MLTQINISQLITIQELHLDIATGTTVITGETGTGKSILIDAIELALGGRASEHLVRPGQEKADISICFDIRKLPEARAWLKNYDLENEECIIRRTISQDGRSRSYINGMPTTLQPLRELGELLMNIHGQHEYQSLLKPEKQRDILDHYACHATLVDQVRALSEEWHTLDAEQRQLQKSAKEHLAKCEFLKFQLHEFEELQINSNEFAALDLEHKQLAHAGELLQNLDSAQTHLTDNALIKAVHALETVAHVEPKIKNWVENINSALIQISDTEAELRRYLDAVDLDPQRLTWVDERLSILFNLARKHRVAPDELYDFKQKLVGELAALENSDERLTELAAKLVTLQKQYLDSAQKLSKSRAKNAKKLADIITASIQKLGIPQAEFHIALESDESTLPTPYGLEKIIFQIKTNAGQVMQPLAKIASGGELSRISLAIHIATAEQHTIPTLIFDEVDVGISGGTAEIVGKLLRQLGKSHQVLCITHLPQVAAQGHHHLCVEKKSEQHTTYTNIQTLTATEKVNEIARLLGGVALTKTTLAHAKEMLANID